MGFGWILIVAIVAGAIWFGVTAARRGTNPATETPEQALKRRYAKGEIDRDTFERMRDDLRK